MAFEYIFIAIFAITKIVTIKTAIDFLDSIQKPHSISEIGKERIRRVAKLLKKSELFNPATMDFGFRNLKLDTSNMNDIYYKPIDFDKEQNEQCTQG